MSLNRVTCGICIGSKNYSVFCYADDIMLTSLTSTGLQRLITAANKHTSSHGQQWRSEWEAGGAAAPRRRPEGGAKILPMNFFNLYTEKFLKI